METILIQTSEVVASALKTLGISPDACALFLDKSRATMYRYLSGESSMPLEALTRLLDLVYDHGVRVESLLGVNQEELYLYHATTEEIVFPIDVYRNASFKNDFGHGFYLGETLRQSATWGKQGKRTRIYRFRKEPFQNLSVLDFDELKPIDWLNFVAVHRKKVKFSSFSKLIEKYGTLDKGFDLVKGKIADSFSFEVLEKLYEDQIDIDQAEYATSIMALGNQYCLKSQAFASGLVPEDVLVLDMTLSEYFHHLAERIQQKQDDNIRLILSRHPKEDRLFSIYWRSRDE